MRAVEAKEGDKGTVDLWRGMKNLRVSDNFMQLSGSDKALCAGELRELV